MDKERNTSSYDEENWRHRWNEIKGKAGSEMTDQEHADYIDILRVYIYK